MNRFKEEFKDQLELIESKEVREFVVHYGNQAPDYYFTSPASFSGKYHPEDENTEGGLLLHCKRVAQYAVEFGFMNDLEPRVVDSMIAAALFHDMYRCGPGDELKTDERHPVYIYHSLQDEKENWPDIQGDIEFISYLCLCHEGRWSHPEIFGLLDSLGLDDDILWLCKIFHTCDYLASRRSLSEIFTNGIYAKGIADGIKIAGQELLKIDVDKILERINE